MIVTIDLEKCTGCGICVDTCVFDTLRLDESTGKAFQAYPEDCKTCWFECEINCPENAIFIHPLTTKPKSVS